MEKWPAISGDWYKCWNLPHQVSPHYFTNFIIPGNVSWDGKPVLSVHLVCVKWCGGFSLVHLEEDLFKQRASKPPTGIFLRIDLMVPWCELCFVPSALEVWALLVEWALWTGPCTSGNHWQSSEATRYIFQITSKRCRKIILILPTTLGISRHCRDQGQDCDSQITNSRIRHECTCYDLD